MKVFEPLSRYSSPSRRAVDAICPNASEPEFGLGDRPGADLVERQAGRGPSACVCAIVPFELIAVAVRPTDTPSAVTMPGEHLQSSMIGNSVNPPPRDSSRSARAALAPAVPAAAASSAAIRLSKPSARERVHPERRVQLAQQVVGREVAVLELLAVRSDLVVDELAHGVAHHLELFGPFEHGRIVRDVVGRPPERAGEPESRATFRGLSGDFTRSARTSDRGFSPAAPGSRCNRLTEEVSGGGNGMDPGGISVARTLPIDGALLDDVLLRLRRDAATSALRWTLGDRGTAEVEIAFTSTGTAACSSWTTRARLWNSSGLAVTAATVHLVAASRRRVEVVLEPSFTPTVASDDEAAALFDLARAALDELAEELLWHATRAGLTPRG